MRSQQIMCTLQIVFLVNLCTHTHAHTGVQTYICTHTETYGSAQMENKALTQTGRAQTA